MEMGESIVLAEAHRHEKYVNLYCIVVSMYTK